MFDRGEHSVFAGASNVCSYQITDLHRIFAKRTGVNDGVCRVGIDVCIGEKIPMHADSTRLGGSDSTEVFREIIFASCTERHSVRKHYRAVEPHGDATLKIGSDQQREL